MSYTWARYSALFQARPSPSSWRDHKQLTVHESYLGEPHDDTQSNQEVNIKSSNHWRQEWEQAGNQDTQAKHELGAKLLGNIATRQLCDDIAVEKRRQESALYGWIPIEFSIVLLKKKKNAQVRSGAIHLCWNAQAPNRNRRILVLRLL